ncbi:MAG: NAD-binding protein [Deltaproteobacteria bacterium]|nr:NAD-binding protein [Deltaproteobacteria bacterium]
MKVLVSLIYSFLEAPETRRNLGVLLKFLAILVGTIVVYTILFHVIMVGLEGRDYSWITGFYWTLTVMSTLGFGDIVFHSDVGKIFSILVLLSGIILLLILLPFTLIRSFYGPWLEAQIRGRAPRQVPEDLAGHVIICGYDALAIGLIERLALYDIAYQLIEPDPAEAARKHREGLSVITGDVDSRETYISLRASRARLILANLGDAVNTNITITARDVAPSVPIVATAEAEDSIDVLELSGCSHVLPLHQQLAARLANRVNAGHAEVHVIGGIRNLRIAEFAVHNTPFAGRTIRETQIREATGVEIVSVWERGKLLPARPDTYLSHASLLMVAGTEQQILELNLLLVIYDINYHPVLVIGGGKVGRATSRAIRRKDVDVHLIERNEALRARIGEIPSRLFIGDAADRDLLMEAGLNDTPAVVLSSSDDATNIYLAVFCRRLNPEVLILSRLTHPRNLEAIYRAGADFALSYTSQGVEDIFAQLHGQELLVIGEGVELFVVPAPPRLVGRDLGGAAVAERTGLTVVGVQQNGVVVTNPPPSTSLHKGSELIMLGNTEQRQAFSRDFG